MRLRLVVELRRQGTQARRIRRAVKQVAASFPAHRETPVCWRLAVTGLGDVVRLRGGPDLVKLSRAPSVVSGWLFLLDARRYREDAERAIAERACEDNKVSRHVPWRMSTRNAAARNREGILTPATHAQWMRVRFPAQHPSLHRIYPSIGLSLLLSRQMDQPARPSSPTGISPPRGLSMNLHYCRLTSRIDVKGICASSVRGGSGAIF